MTFFPVLAFWTKKNLATLFAIQNRITNFFRAFVTVAFWLGTFALFFFIAIKRGSSWMRSPDLPFAFLQPDFHFDSADFL
jgi:hypothetical protein